MRPGRLPSLQRRQPTLRAAALAAGARMGVMSWFSLGPKPPLDPSTVTFLALTPRPTLAHRLQEWLGSKKFLGVLGQGGLPTLVAEVILVVATLSLFQLLIRFVRQVLAIIKEIRRRDDEHEGNGPHTDDGTGPTGSPRNPLSAPPGGLPALPLLGLVISVLGASALDSFAASGLLAKATVKAYLRWIVGLRLGCDLLLEVALAAVALHLLDVLRSRIVSEETAALGQKIMGGSSPQQDTGAQPSGGGLRAPRPRTLDRRASINEARLNTLVQTLSAGVWVCTVFALLDTVGVKFQARGAAARCCGRRRVCRGQRAHSAALPRTARPASPEPCSSLAHLGGPSSPSACCAGCGGAPPA